MPHSSLHAAIIMDGNGRWAEQRGLLRMDGHRAGAEALRGIVRAAPRSNVGVLTVYAFSADNWKRPVVEVNALMFLLACYLEQEAGRLRDEGVRTTAIGRRDRIPKQLAKAIERTEEMTSHGSRLDFRLAIDYSSRAAILSGSSSHSEPVDLLIRTGGEHRLSDFLLWESAYAELIFSPRMWPDYTPEDFRAAVAEFHRRSRRFGALPAPSAFSDRWLR